MRDEMFPLAGLNRAIDEIRRRLAALERPDATQIGSLIAQVQAALATVDARVDAAVSASSYTRSQIDAKLASPGAIAPTDVTASGTVTATAGLVSPDVYSRNLTGSGTSKVVYVAPSGQIGNLPSSRLYKQDIVTAPSPTDALLAMRVVTFRYRQAVELLGDAAEVEWGAIAEELHELGMTWAVIYDEEGQPDGVKYERLVLAVVPVVQDHERRLGRLERS